MRRNAFAILIVVTVYLLLEVIKYHNSFSNNNVIFINGKQVLIMEYYPRRTWLDIREPTHLEFEYDNTVSD